MFDSLEVKLVIYSMRDFEKSGHYIWSQLMVWLWTVTLRGNCERRNSIFNLISISMKSWNKLLATLFSLSLSLSSFPFHPLCLLSFYVWEGEWLEKCNYQHRNPFTPQRWSRAEWKSALHNFNHTCVSWLIILKYIPAPDNVTLA